MRGLIALLKDAGVGWSEDNAQRMGAALAYYAIFSLAPILVIAIAVAGFVFGKDAVEGQFAGQIAQVVGEEGAQTIQTMLANAEAPGTNTLSAIVGVGMLFIGAMGLFSELRSAMNTVWKAEPSGSSTLWEFVHGYLLSLLMVFVIAALLFLSMVANTVLTTLGAHFAELKTSLGNPWVSRLILWLITTLLFAMIYRLLPDKPVAWRDVWLGAGITSLLFGSGSWLIGIYLVHAGVGSVYGAAGSLAVLLTWLYYSAQVFLFGAELTKAVAKRHGRLQSE
jgi:membrane protein